MACSVLRVYKPIHNNRKRITFCWDWSRKFIIQIYPRIASSSATDTPWHDANNFKFAIIVHNQWAPGVPLVHQQHRKLYKWQYVSKLQRLFTWHESCFPFPAHTIFGVIRDDRYFMLRHWVNDKIGTSTCCTTLGKAPCSDVLPQPTAMPVFPDGSKSSPGKHTGIIFVPYWIGLRSFNNAMSWLYVFASKYRCFIIALTARILASASFITVWSWSPKIMRIFERFTRRTQWAAVNTYSLDINDAPQWKWPS